MKFLKTFLFTISFCFIFGSIMSLCGYCQALPSAPLDSSSFEVLEGGMQSYSYFGSCPEMLPFYIDQIYNDIDNKLYFSTGYDIEDYCDMAESKYIEKIDEAGFGQGNPSGGLSSSQAQWLANRFTNGLNNGVALGTLGYCMIKQAVPQFGQNAKAWFLGKYDDVNNKFTNVCNNFVVKMTSQGLANYTSSVNSLVQDGLISNNTDLGYYFSDVLSFNSEGYYYYCKFPSSHLFVNNPSVGTKYICCDNVTVAGGSVNGYRINTLTGVRETFNFCQLSDGFIYTDSNNINHSFNRIRFIDVSGSSNVDIQPTFELPSDLTSFNWSLLGSSVGNFVFEYNSNSIKSLLEQLIGYYVDNQSLNRINTIIREIPVVTETINNFSVPVAEPSPDQLNDLQALIDEIKVLSANYDALELEDSVPEPEPEPEPEPSPNNQGTDVPEDFPTIIFSPINDSVGSVFDFVSIFEPLFYIFSFSSGLLGLWFVVPFVILFLILFRLLK